MTATRYHHILTGQMVLAEPFRKDDPVQRSQYRIDAVSLADMANGSKPYRQRDLGVGIADGDWLVNGVHTKIMSDEQFHHTYVKVIEEEEQ